MAYNITKLSSTSTIKKVAFFLIIIASLIVINGLIRSIFDLWSKQDVVTRARSELNREKQKNEELKAQLSFVKSDEFLEAQARDKLFLVKPGESGVIVPSELIKKKEEKKVIVVPTWQQWINLFVSSK